MTNFFYKKKIRKIFQDLKRLGSLKTKPPIKWIYGGSINGIQVMLKDDSKFEIAHDGLTGHLTVSILRNKKLHCLELYPNELEPPYKEKLEKWLKDPKNDLVLSPQDTIPAYQTRFINFIDYVKTN